MDIDRGIQTIVYTKNYFTKLNIKANERPTVESFDVDLNSACEIDEWRTQLSLSGAAKRTGKGSGRLYIVQRTMKQDQYTQRYPHLLIFSEETVLPSVRTSPPSACLDTHVKTDSNATIGFRYPLTNSINISSEKVFNFVTDDAVINKTHTHSVCDNCGFDSQFKTSNSKNNAYEANIRLTYSMRCVGVGREGTNLVCGLMNMPPPTIRYTDTNNVLLKSLKKVCDESMTKAVQQAVSVNDCDGNDLSVSCDGTWMRRGFSSLYGVSTVVSIDTGKVLDAQVLSKYCTTCSTRKKSLNKNEEEQWEQNHAKSCCKNYHGSSGGMEAAGMKLIFHRSQEKYGVRYVKYLGDGDSSAFKSVFESEPYGSDCPIEKLECVGHVQKHMGSRLLKLTKDMKGKKLEDGKGIGGAGRLTKKEIQSIQMYYGPAIRQNVGNLDSMQHAVWAIYFHKLSTDAKPQHGLCGEWCPYKKARNNAINIVYQSQS
ncbi:hypothetical protein ANN_09248 [Periplaneta americana]|uniref:Mutator-like transposase domain-containing protein n=1 Tax=Periplaneta americana TaxID=6978 RepID=A0ABQ8TNQ4_PERAM|nr:hypothetical protein ANN_09248 [Periplaneta americana]